MNLLVPNFKFRRLVKDIQNSEVDPAVLAEMPVLLLYAALDDAGFHECLDIVLDLKAEKISKLLDIKLWRGCDIEEEEVLSLLELIDSADYVDSSTKLLLSIDPKIYAYLFSKLNFIVDPEMKSEEGEMLFDSVSVQFPSDFSERQLSLYARLFRLIYDYDADLFFRLVQVSMSYTPMSLAEEAFLDKERRLADELPELEYANQRIFTATPLYMITERLGVNFKSLGPEALFNDENIDRELIGGDLALLNFYTNNCYPYFNQLIKKRDVQGELAMLVNCGFVAMQASIPFLIEYVGATCNIGIEHLVRRGGLTAKELYDELDLIGLYSHGLSLILKLRKTLNKRELTKEQIDKDATMSGIKCYYVPLFFEENANLLTNLRHFRPFSCLSEIFQVEDRLSTCE